MAPQDAATQALEEQVAVARMHRTARVRLLRTSALTLGLGIGAMALGVWAGWVIFIGGTVLFAAAWDYRKRGHSSGGWISPPMGSLAAGGHTAYVTSCQGDTLVDATGRNWALRRKAPTPEQIATGHGDDGPSLIVMLLGSAAFVGVMLLIYWFAK